jgi:hypothetical protein
MRNGRTQWYEKHITDKIMRMKNSEQYSTFCDVRMSNSVVLIVIQLEAKARQWILF